MSVLVDTNILLRSAQPNHPLQGTALEAVPVLRGNGETLSILPQILYEFWVICTRPVTENGLGFPVTQMEQEIDRLQRMFHLLEETPGVFPEWQKLVIKHQVVGKTAHDAHVVAGRTLHSIDRILTFNVQDFKRFPEITAMSPQQILAARTP